MSMKTQMVPIMSEAVDIIINPIESLNENNVFEGELLNLVDTETKIKTITEKATDVVNMQEVASDLLKDNVINKAVVETLSKYVTNIKDNVVMESLTEAPTPIMFKEVKKEVEKELNDKLTEVRSEISEFYDVDVKKTLSIIDAFLNSNFTDFRYLIADLQKLSISTLEDISSTKNTIIPIKNEAVRFIDVVAIDGNELLTLKDYDSEHIDFNKLIELLDISNKIIESNLITKYIFNSFCELKDVDLNADISMMSEYKDYQITVEKILKFFASDNTRIFIENIDKELLDIKTVIENELEHLNYSDEEYCINATITVSINRCANVFMGLFNISRLSKNVFELINTIRPLLK